MAFKPTKDDDRPKVKLVSFRLPDDLMESVRRIAEREKISTTKLVKQMLQHCVRTYQKN